MTMRFLIAWLAVGLLGTCGCAERPKVATDFDPSVEFSTFRTFAFAGIMDRGREVGVSDTSPLRRRVKDMVNEQLAAKGIRQVKLEDHPDLLVHLFYGVKDLQHIQKTGAMVDFYNRHVATYAYQDGDWVPVKTSAVMTYEDHEGTMIVDLADASKRKLVWRAVINAVLKYRLEENFELANKGIAKAFEDYPAIK